MRPVFALCALLLAAAPLRAADATDRLSRAVPLPEGGTIRVDATIADLTIVGTDRTDVQIDIVRHAPTAADLSGFPPVIDAAVDGIHVSIIQADEGRNPRLRAEVTLSVPKAAALQAVRVFEGRVTVTNLRAACDVTVERGAIEASRLAGRIRLEASLGSVDVRQSELTPGGMMRLRVFNGPVRVRFAKTPANARILAVTFNGSLTSDLPLTRKDKFGPNFGETTIGSGDPVLSIDVVKGDVSIKVG